MDLPEALSARRDSPVQFLRGFSPIDLFVSADWQRVICRRSGMGAAAPVRAARGKCAFSFQTLVVLLMNLKSKSLGNVAQPLGRRCGFTLIELLAIIGIVTLLSGLLVPVLHEARRRALRTECLSNLKKIGLGIELYAGDHAGTLPGAARAGACASYDVTSENELAWFVADEMGLPKPSFETVLARPFVCPAYERSAPVVASMIGRRCYLLNENVGTNSAAPVRPFGQPGDPAGPPLTYAGLEEFGPPCELFAITDMDKGNVNPTVSWWADLPYQPVHGRARNRLFFDGHVASRPW